MLCSSPSLGVEPAQVNIEHRQFFSDGAQGQEKQTSLVLQPELYWDLQDGDASFTFTPFIAGIAWMMSVLMVIFEKFTFNLLG